MRGTPRAYELLLQSAEKPNVDTLYFISENDSSNATLYLGEKLIAGGSAGDINLSNLKDIVLSTDLKDKSFLIYDKGSGKWVDATLDEALSVFIGANSNASGQAGLVPAPPQGGQNLFLRGDGTWAPVEVSREPRIWHEENDDPTTMHQVIIDRETQGEVLAAGDIFIIKDIIYGDKFQHTSYVYNGSNWAAMDGNYNAENVFFDEDFVFTKAIGTVEIPSTGRVEVEAAGKNIKDFLASIFAKEENPVTSNPYITIASDTAKAYEVGTFVTPVYTVTFNSGSYTYGPDTEVTATSYEITDGTNVKDTTSGSMPELQVTDSTNYRMYATAEYSDGTTPKTNMGNDYIEGAIVAGTTDEVVSNAITGFRYAFAGPDVSEADLNSDFIRGLRKIGNGAINHTITWKAADTENIKRYIVAIPASSTKKVSNVLITSSMNADCTAEYVLQDTTVDVLGANDYEAVPYNIWIYKPASIASVEVHNITIG